MSFCKSDSQQAGFLGSLLWRRDWFPGRVSADVGQSSLFIYALAIVFLYRILLLLLCFQIYEILCSLILGDSYNLSFLALSSVLTLPEVCWFSSPQVFAFLLFLKKCYFAKYGHGFFCNHYSVLCSNVTS